MRQSDRSFKPSHLLTSIARRATEVPTFYSALRPTPDPDFRPLGIYKYTERPLFVSCTKELAPAAQLDMLKYNEIRT